MKNIILAIVFTFLSHALLAQQDTAKIEQYCQLIASPRLFSNKVTIAVDFGAVKSFWSDTRLRNYDGTLKKFNTIIDALNFMGREGWLFVDAYPVRNGNSEVYHYGFKKLFPRPAVIE